VDLLVFCDDAQLYTATTSSIWMARLQLCGAG
jgi:hypothetical protein